MSKRLAIAGSGAIACGLAATAAHHGPVLLLARSDSSAERARATVEKTLDKLGAEVDPEHIQIVTDPQELAPATYVVEAVVEDHDIKARLHAETRRDHRCGCDPRDHHLVAVRTAARRRQRAARSLPRAARVQPRHQDATDRAGLPAAASAETRARTLAMCEDFEKTPVEVPDIPGFVVNRLLFPYLFSAVRLLEETGMDPEDIDTCMRLGAGHPMGPLALLDLVGLDVSAAIGETIGEPVPARVQELISEGALGRKSGRGLHSY